MKDLVVVRSKTVNNESVPIKIMVVTPGTGEIDPLTGKKEEREITRSVIFKDFQAEMPLKWAKSLIKAHEENSPDEFHIVEAAGELSKRAEKTVEVAQEKSKGFKCEFCGAEAKSKAGLSAHVRYNHPDKWEGKKTVKTEVKE